MMKKRLLAMVLALCLMVSMVPFQTWAASPVEGGYCGYSVQWMVYSDGVLQIYGFGDMDDYSWETPAPWTKYIASISQIKVLNGVTGIGDYAFSDCENVSEVTIADTVTRIGMGAFGGCSSLYQITIPERVTQIGAGAFSYCTHLTEITIPNGVTGIEASTFSGCTNLTSVSIPNTVTWIGRGAFEDCTSLCDVGIPDSVTEIDGFAFMRCASLTTLNIPDRVTCIGEYAFSETGLTDITIPASVTEMGMDVFYDCMDLTHVTYGAEVLPGDGIFRVCNNLTEIHFVEGVKTIKAHALSMQESLTTVRIPVSMTDIGDSAFYWCTALTDVYYAGTERQWNEIHIGIENESLLNATIHFGSTEKVDLIDSGACGESVFWELYEDGLLKICGIGEMKDYSWQEFSPWTTYLVCVQKVEISEGVTSIGNRAFHGCSQIQTVTIPASVTRIGSEAFFDCKSLTSIAIPDGVEVIENYTFGHCTSMASVTIPDSVTEIKAYAFYNCTGLTDAYYSGTAEQWSAIAIGDNNLELTNATIHCSRFPDVPEDTWYTDPVLWAVENGITTGKGNGNFAPTEACTRAQVVTFLWRAADCPEPQSMNHNFTDVAAGSYYEKAVIWAVENGITAGKGGATTFKPDTTCTRAEVVTFLWRAKGKPEPQNTENSFPDVPAGSYYEQAVLWAVENGITTGKGNGNFAPTEACTRAHVVTFLYRAFAE